MRAGLYLDHIDWIQSKSDSGVGIFTTPKRQAANRAIANAKLCDQLWPMANPNQSCEIWRDFKALVSADSRAYGKISLDTNKRATRQLTEH